MEQRNNIRSFRFSDSVLKHISEFAGDSLNDKFNNLIVYCCDRIPDRKKQLQIIEDDIDRKRNQYNDLCKKLREVDDLINTLKTLQRYGEIAVSKAESIAK